MSSTRATFHRVLLAAIVPVLAFSANVPSAQAAGYAGSNGAIQNIQASTTPVKLRCPADAPWLRDPAVCASRWSTAANDKSESDLAVDPTDPNHIVGYRWAS